MSEVVVREFLEKLASALSAVGVLPWWGYLLATLIVIPALFGFYHVSQRWPPNEEWKQPEHFYPMDANVSMPLNQKPPDSWL